MTAVRRYEACMYDSNRWDGFGLRPGDIIIGTPAKVGDDVNADLRPAHTAGTGAPVPVGHALAQSG
jgi:hypothetical protein